MAEEKEIRLKKRSIEDEMKENYIDYAMSVIIGRALPDIRDGLKPVHRRILYAMQELGIVRSKPHKKSARITGEVLGRFHPHGDQAVYDSLVRMAQWFSLRYMIIDGQGNFGCFTKETKVRLTDGRELAFEELVKEDKENKINYTYTINSKGSVEIARIDNPRLTKKKQEIMEITFDNGEKVRCTLDHKFMLRDGEYKQARYLQSNDSLMPLYTKLSGKNDITKPKLMGYEMIYQPKLNDWSPSHMLADEWNLKNKIYEKPHGRIRHHKNEPEYRKKISKGRENDVYKQYMIDCYKKKWRDDPNFRASFMPILTENGGNSHYSMFVQLCKNVVKNHGELTPENYEKERIKYGTCKGEGIIKFEKAVNKYFYNDSEKMTQDLEKIGVLNHKVKNVKFLGVLEDVYDLSIGGSHNFCLASGVFVHNSIDGDPPAAMRYTEARMSKIAEELLMDIEKKTVDFVPNFDASTEEPVVLPSRIPNLLINGSSGIAVGMSTNIPPHNLTEISDAVLKLIENPEVEIETLMGIVKGPDFPTGGIICGRSGILQAYRTGKGIIKTRALAEIEKEGVIVISEIPYMVNKSNLIEHIAELVKDKKIEGIRNLRDESDKDGIRVVIELQQGMNAELILNKLYQHTAMESSFGIINLALVNNRPKVLTLKEMLIEFISHRKEIITRRTQYLLEKAKARAHILEGLQIALSNIDRVVAIIKKSKDPRVAKKELRAQFKLSDIQADAILQMRLQTLTGLEQGKIKAEYDQLVQDIAKYQKILGSEHEIMQIIIQETSEIKEKYGDERRTQISDQDYDLCDEDLITKEDVIVTLTNRGYVKRVPVEEYKMQKRGGKGITATGTGEDGYVKEMFISNSHDYLLLFTNKGRVHWLRTFQLPTGSRYSMGKAIVNYIHLDEDEKVSKVVTVEGFDKGKFLIFSTKNGKVKKTAMKAYSKPRKGGIIAISLKEKDKLIDVEVTDGKRKIFLATRKGNSIKFKETDVREMGRSAGGVRGIRLRKGDEVIGMEILEDGEQILTVSELGYGKRTVSEQYKVQKRGGVGVKNMKVVDKNGPVQAIKKVSGEEGEHLMLISNRGTAIRLETRGISMIGRATQGVRVMRLNEGDKLEDISLLDENGEEEAEEIQKEQNSD